MEQMKLDFLYKVPSCSCGNKATIFQTNIDMKEEPFCKKCYDKMTEEKEREVTT